MRTLERRIARVEQSRNPKFTPEERYARLRRLLKYGDPENPQITRINEILRVAKDRRNAGSKALE